MITRYKLHITDNIYMYVKWHNVNGRWYKTQFIANLTEHNKKVLARKGEK